MESEQSRTSAGHLFALRQHARVTADAGQPLAPAMRSMAGGFVFGAAVHSVIEYDDEIDEYLDNVVLYPSGESRLDYAYDVKAPCWWKQHSAVLCPVDWCWCCDWIDWIRQQPVYPLPTLGHPALKHAPQTL